VTVTDSAGNSGSQAYSVTVSAARALPNLDPNTHALVRMQFDGATRIAESNIADVMRRLESTRTRSPCSFEQNIQLRDVSSTKSQTIEGFEGLHNQSMSTCKRSSINVWAAGSADINDDRAALETKSLMIGADTKISPQFGAGFMIGVANDNIKLPGIAQSRTTSRSLALYGDVQVTTSTFIDWTIGYSRMMMDSQRAIENHTIEADSSRSGSVLFGSVRAGDTISLRGLNATAYLRYDHIRASLGEMTESGHSLAVKLASSGRRLHVLSSGAKFDTKVLTPYGTVTPFLRAEYKLRSTASQSQVVAYSDLPTSEQTLSFSSDGDASLSGSIGVGWNIRGLQFDLEVGSSELSTNSLEGTRARLAVSKGL
jgi:hypothetical protein